MVANPATDKPYDFDGVFLDNSDNFRPPKGEFNLSKNPSFPFNLQWSNFHSK